MKKAASENQNYISKNISGKKISSYIFRFLFWYYTRIDFGGIEVAYWPLVPKFAGSNPAEAVGCLRAKKSSARLPSEGK